MSEQISQAFLLKKTLLANDDAALTFLTEKEGTQTVFVKSFARSKKRQTEIDYFRLLQIKTFTGRTGSVSLRGAETARVFSFLSDYDLSQIGFLWLDVLQKICPEGKDAAILFHLLVKCMESISLDNKEKVDAFFQMKALEWAGLITRFDSVRKETYFDAREFHFLSTENPNTVFLSNTTRQLLEFYRRADLHEVLEKVEKLPLKETNEVRNVLSIVRKQHI